MKTKSQKQQEIESHKSRLAENKTIIFTDLNKVPAKDISDFRQELEPLDTEFKVAKKRLLRLVFESAGIPINPEDYPTQLGVIFSDRELVDIASLVARFAKAHEGFNVLGGFDLTAKTVLQSDYINRISSLPGREVLLGQLVGMLASPLKLFMLTLKERAKQLESQPA